MTQLGFIGQEPPARIRILILPDHRSGHPPQLWFRWKDDWVRQAWCGQFLDGSPRPPWFDDLFMHLWETEGADAARDKSRYDLRDVAAALSHISARPPSKITHAEGERA